MIAFKIAILLVLLGALLLGLRMTAVPASEG